MTPLCLSCLAACLLAGAHPVACAADERRGLPGGAGIPSCVSPDWIHFGSQDQRAVLDPADHRLVRAEMIRRYPVIETDGFPSTRTILWQQRSGERLYIAVIDPPALPGDACFTATFSADRFDVTPRLRSKYLAPPK